MPTEDDLLQEVIDEVPLGPIVTLAKRSEDPEQPKDDGIGFDPKYREPFIGLLFVGHLKKTVPYVGHTFELETPSQNERLEAGLVHKRYLDSLSSEQAWAAITVATYLRVVDKTPLPEPLGPRDIGVQERTNWVLDNLKQPIIRKLFEECLILDDEVERLLAELEKAGEA